MSTTPARSRNTLSDSLRLWPVYLVPLLIAVAFSWLLLQRGEPTSGLPRLAVSQLGNDRLEGQQLEVTGIVVGIARTNDDVGYRWQLLLGSSLVDPSPLPCLLRDEPTGEVGKPLSVTGRLHGHTLLEAKVVRRGWW